MAVGDHAIGPCASRNVVCLFHRRWPGAFDLVNGHVAQDHAELAAILDRMDDPQITTGEFNSLDTAFHVRIAEAAGNALTAHLMGSLRLAIRQQMIDAYARLADWRTTAVTVRAEHRAILDAIDKRQTDNARTLVRDHIRSFYLRTETAESPTV